MLLTAQQLAQLGDARHVVLVTPKLPQHVCQLAFCVIYLVAHVRVSCRVFGVERSYLRDEVAHNGFGKGQELGLQRLYPLGGQQIIALGVGQALDDLLGRLLKGYSRFLIRLLEAFLLIEQLLRTNQSLFEIVFRVLSDSLHSLLELRRYKRTFVVDSSRGSLVFLVEAFENLVYFLRYLA